MKKTRKKQKRKDGRKVEKKGESVKKCMSLLADLQRDGIITLHGFSFTAASINNLTTHLCEVQKSIQLASESAKCRNSFNH